MARQSLKALLGSLIEQVRDSKVPIRSIEFDPSTKRIKVDFGGTGPVDAQPQSLPGRPEEPPKMVSGTDIPDDDTPLHPLDTVLRPASYELDS